MSKPKILKKSDNKIDESGCCFRSCGGVPGISRYSSKSGKTEDKLSEIK